MKIRIGLVVISILLVNSNTLSQSKTGRTTPPRTRAATPAAKPRVPGYQLNLRIVEGARLYLSVVSTSGGDDIKANDLNALITDLPTGAGEHSIPNNVFPKVMVEASPGITMLSFWNPLTLFRTDRTTMTVSLPGDTMLDVIWPRRDAEVKPNPLLLFVEVGADGKLSLNRESAGSISEPQALQDRLRTLFREREANGVFRENTNEVETAVTIIMPMGERRFGDLISLADSIKKAGAGWIYLSMVDPIPVIEELKIEDLPPIPPPNRRPR